MPFKITDSLWSILRPTDVHSRPSRMTEVSYNNAVLMKPFSAASADDSAYVYDTTLRVSGTDVADYVGYVFGIGVRDAVAMSERLAFTWDYKFYDAAVAASRLFVTMRPPAVAEVHAPSDKVALSFTSTCRSASASADVLRTVFEASAKDPATAASFQAFSFIGTFKSSLPASTDKLLFTLSVAARDSSAAADRVLSTMSVLLKDVVVASSSFLLGGQSFLDTASHGFSSDAFYSTLVAKSPDSAATSDSVVIGIRYLIEAYFGGLAIGGSPFGGRL